MGLGQGLHALVRSATNHKLTEHLRKRGDFSSLVHYCQARLGQASPDLHKVLSTHTDHQTIAPLLQATRSAPAAEANHPLSGVLDPPSLLHSNRPPNLAVHFAAGSHC